MLEFKGEELCIRKDKERSRVCVYGEQTLGV